MRCTLSLLLLAISVDVAGAAQPSVSNSTTASAPFMSIEDLAEDYYNTLESALDNKLTALENFQTVVKSDAKNDITTGISGVEGVVAPEFDAIAEAAAGLVPHGEIAKSIATLITGKDPTGNALISNNLKDYITDARSRIGKLRATIKTNRATDEARVRNSYGSLNEEEKKKFYHQYDERLAKIKALYIAEYNEVTYFNNIVQAWILDNNKTSLMTYNDPYHQTYHRLVLIFDEKWQLRYSFIQGTLGSKLTEQLGRTNKAGVDIKFLRIPVEVKWFPEGLNDNGGCGGIFDELGHLKKIIYTNSGDIYLVNFAKNLREKGVDQRNFNLEVPKEKWGFWKVLDAIRAVLPFGGNIYQQTHSLDNCCGWGVLGKDNCAPATTCVVKFRYPNF